MKKAIVTGATGAVGTALVNKLISENVETLVLVRKGGRVNKTVSYTHLRANETRRQLVLRLVL